MRNLLSTCMIYGESLLVVKFKRRRRKKKKTRACALWQASNASAQLWPSCSFCPQTGCCSGT